MPRDSKDTGVDGNEFATSLNTHKFDSLTGSEDEEVFEAYVENKTPAAFRIFWYYGSGQGVIITPHP